MDNFDELFSRAAGWLFVTVGVDEMGPYVVLEHDSQQAVHRTTAARDLLQHVGTSMLLFERPLNGFDLPLDAADPI